MFLHSSKSLYFCLVDVRGWCFCFSECFTNFLSHRKESKVGCYFFLRETCKREYSGAVFSLLLLFPYPFAHISVLESLIVTTTEMLVSPFSPFSHNVEVFATFLSCRKQRTMITGEHLILHGETMTISTSIFGEL